MARPDPGTPVPGFPTNLAEALHHLHVYHGISIDLIDASDPRVADNVRLHLAAGRNLTPRFVATLIELARLNDARKAHDEHTYNVGTGTAAMPIHHWHLAN